MSNIAQSTAFPMDTSQALNIFQWDEMPPQEDLASLVEEHIFPMKQFFLMNIPIPLLWKKRIRQLEKETEAAEHLGLLSPKLEALEESSFNLQRYDDSMSRWKLRLSASAHPAEMAFAAKAMVAEEMSYMHWILALSVEKRYSLEAPKSVDKLAAHRLLKLQQEEEQWMSHPAFLKERARVEKLMQLKSRN